MPIDQPESILVRVPYERIYGKPFPTVCLLSDQITMGTDGLNDLAINMLDSVLYNSAHYIDNIVYEICDAIYEDPETGTVNDVTEYSILGGILTTVGQQAKAIANMLPKHGVGGYNLAYVCTKDENLFFVATREPNEDY